MSANSDAIEEDCISRTAPDLCEESEGTVKNSLPDKSKAVYEISYNRFLAWQKEEHGTTSFSQMVLMAYFSALSKKWKSSTLWSEYSKLAKMVKIKQNVDLGEYVELKSFLKKMSVGYRPKKSNTLSLRNVEQYLNEAPDHTCLATKVAMIFGVLGACRKEELIKVEVTHLRTYYGSEDTQKKHPMLLVHLPDRNTNQGREFTVKGKFYEFYQRYSDLRPELTAHNRFFVNYQKGRCTVQPIGEKKFGSMPKEVARFLKLPNPESYTGHAFRRTLATLLAESGADITSLKQHGSSLISDRKIVNQINSSILLSPSSSRQDTSLTENPRDHRRKNQMEKVSLDPEVEEEFHACMESANSEDMKIPIEQMETIFIASPMLSKTHESLRSDEQLLDENRLPPFCRLCAIPCNDMINIFGPTVFHKSILEKIQHCLPITVKNTDVLSKKVCRSCLEKLEACYQFHKTVAQADKQLLMIHEQTSHIAMQCADSNETSWKRGSEVNTNESIYLAEDMGTWNSHYDNQSTQRSKETINSGATSAIKPKQEIRYSPPSSPLQEKNWQEQIDSGEDVADPLNHSSIDTFTRRQSNPGVITHPNPTKKSSHRLRNKPPWEYYTDNDDSPSSDEAAEGFAPTNQSSSGQTIKCHLCGDRLQTIAKCCIHARIHASANYYPCCFCDRLLTTEKEWEEHWEEHIVDTDSREFQRAAMFYSSNECARELATENELQYHKHEVNNLICHKRCDEGSHSEAFLQHETILGNNKLGISYGKTLAIQGRSEKKTYSGRNWYSIFKCSCCKRKFSSRLSLERHTTMFCFDSRKRLTCDYCEKVFHSKNHLAAHIRMHTRERPYSCDICRKIFRFESTLRRHRKFHTGERPSQCSMCEETFKSNAALKEHMDDIHLAKKSFPCSLCDKEFTRAKIRDIHMGSHTGQRSYKCDLCEALFSWPSNLRNHKKLKHRPRFRLRVLSSITPH